MHNLRTFLQKSLDLRAGASLGLLAFSAFLGSATLASADIAAVSADRVNGYDRERLDDNTYKPETYAFAEGGLMDAAIAGGTLRETTFKQIVLTLAPALAKQKYYPSKDPDLLIFVFWGATKGTKGATQNPAYDNVRESLVDVASAGRSGDRDAMLAAAERSDGYLGELQVLNRQRLDVNVHNAQILGFGPDLQRALELSFTSMAQDLTEDLEDSRYFVVLKAYDFKLAKKEKKRKLLWETRFSVRSSNSDFREQLPAMIQYAGHFFGENSGGLVRRPMPKVQVDIGTPVYLGEEPAK